MPKKTAPAKVEFIESSSLDKAVENFLIIGYSNMEEEELIRCLDSMAMFAQAAPDKFKKVFSKEFIQKASDTKGFNPLGILDLVNLVMS